MCPSIAPACGSGAIASRLAPPILAITRSDTHAHHWFGHSTFRLEFGSTVLMLDRS
jgi:hypothetical protein